MELRETRRKHKDKPKRCRRRQVKRKMTAEERVGGGKERAQRNVMEGREEERTMSEKA